MTKKIVNWREILEPYEGQIPKGGVEKVEKLGERPAPKKYSQEEICSAKVNIARFFCRDVEKITGVANCDVKKWDKKCKKFHIIATYEVTGLETSNGKFYLPYNKDWTLSMISKGIRENEKVYPSLTVNDIKHPKIEYKTDVMSPLTGFKRLVRLYDDHSELDVTII